MPPRPARARRPAAAPGGAAPADWLDLVFGQLEGWWRFGDHDLRPDHALAGSAPGARALGEAGLEETEALAVRADGRLAPSDGARARPEAHCPAPRGAG